ncbi:MAG: J domain-containing protein [Anaerovoracaceae bacterium]|jgi:molecular chaperone DnaJ
MDNPYETLGIKEGASPDEIKKAYREQVKKYHPDRYQENPLQDLAEEKLREINRAYEQLMGGGGGMGAGNSEGSFRNSQEFREVRRFIDMGQLDRAEAILLKSGNRGAEWHFLSGMIALRRGWYDEAISGVQIAISMDPGNMEYKSAMNSLMGASGAFRQDAYGRGYNNSGDELCRMCTCCMCLDCLTGC